MEVPEHLVEYPAANQIDDVAVDDQTEELYGTSGMEIAGGHGLGFKS